ncbi:MAG TPA: hypothetical protein DCP92_20870 [Nitrospiraceae bacterium]|jgi:phosphatidylglycerophosphate synthase|nr:hypothetical protein [Nitrospiraceae bacterium]
MDTLRRQILTVPNILSIARLGVAFTLPVLAWRGEATLFLVCLILALLSDAADGWIARVLSQTSILGTKLDSWADLALSLAVPICVWRLWPSLV